MESLPNGGLAPMQSGCELTSCSEYSQFVRGSVFSLILGVLISLFEKDLSFFYQRSDSREILVPVG
jgi:hypothetical protein